MVCTASPSFTADLPNRETPEARRGTFLHMITEICLRENLQADQLIGHKHLEHTFEDPNDIDAVQQCLDYVRVILAFGGTYWLEQRVHVSADLHGTADLIVYNPQTKTLHVIDFKFGKGKLVIVSQSPQLAIYGIGGLYFAAQMHLDVQQVTTHVVQPSHWSGDNKKAMTYTAADLQAWADNTLAPKANETKTGGVFVPGDHCGFCPGRGTCITFANSVLAPLGVTITDPTQTSLPVVDVNAMPTEAIVRLHEMKGDVSSLLAAVTEELQRRTVAGENTGYMIEQVEGNTRWIDDEKAIAKALRARGLKPTQPKLVTVTDAKKQLRDEFAGLTDKKAAALLAGLGLTERRASPKLSKAHEGAIPFNADSIVTLTGNQPTQPTQ